MYFTVTKNASVNVVNMFSGENYSSVHAGIEVFNNDVSFKTTISHEFACYLSEIIDEDAGGFKLFLEEFTNSPESLSAGQEFAVKEI